MRKVRTWVFAMMTANLAFSGSALAEFNTPGKLQDIRRHESGCVLLRVRNGDFNQYGYLVIDANQPGRDGMYATALAAQLAGKNVQVNRVQRAPDPCWGLVDRATEILIIP